HAKILGEIGWSERDRVDAIDRQDLVDVGEGFGGLQHDCHVDLFVQVAQARSGAKRAIEVGAWTQPRHAAVADGRVARGLGNLVGDLGRVDLGNVEFLHANVE